MSMGMVFSNNFIDDHTLFVKKTLNKNTQPFFFYASYFLPEGILIYSKYKDHCVCDFHNKWILVSGWLILHF